MKRPKTNAEALTNKCLLELEKTGMVRRFIQNGKEVWEATEKGQAMANRENN